jgi:hypothetical protein
MVDEVAGRPPAGPPPRPRPTREGLRAVPRAPRGGIVEVNVEVEEEIKEVEKKPRANRFGLCRARLGRVTKLMAGSPPWIGAAVPNQAETRQRRRQGM